MKIEKLLTTINEEITQNFFKEPKLKRNTSFEISTYCKWEIYHEKFGILLLNFDWKISKSSPKANSSEFHKLVEMLIKSTIAKYNVDGFTQRVNYQGMHLYYNISPITNDVTKLFIIKNIANFDFTDDYGVVIENVTVHLDNMNTQEAMDCLMKINYEGEITLERTERISRGWFDGLKRAYKLHDLSPFFTDPIVSECDFSFYPKNPNNESLNN
jgi:hypothetical protein